MAFVNRGNGIGQIDGHGRRPAAAGDAGDSDRFGLVAVKAMSRQMASIPECKSSESTGVVTTWAAPARLARISRVASCSRGALTMARIGQLKSTLETFKVLNVLKPADVENGQVGFVFVPGPFLNRIVDVGESGIDEQIVGFERLADQGEAASLKLTRTVLSGYIAGSSDSIRRSVTCALLRVDRTLPASFKRSMQNGKNK